MRIGFALLIRLMSFARLLLMMLIVVFIGVAILVWVVRCFIYAGAVSAVNWRWRNEYPINYYKLGFLRQRKANNNIASGNQRMMLAHLQDFMFIPIGGKWAKNLHHTHSMTHLHHLICPNEGSC